MEIHHTTTILPKDYQYELLDNVHLVLPSPTINGKSYLAAGSYKYFHYKCDGQNDVGWGCAYRTLQSLCSQVKHCKKTNGCEQNLSEVPSILEIQQTLVNLGDKFNNFILSKDWIGAVEVFMVLDSLYDVSCKIVHINRGKEITNHIETIREHFDEFGGLIMMGGDQDAASKGIAGIHISDAGTYLLVVDPHFVGSPQSAQHLAIEGFVSWHNINSFSKNSFYNLCMPQIIIK